MTDNELTVLPPLSDDERDLLQSCEVRIARNTYDSWKTLREIYEKKLWRDYKTFEDYCQERWHIEKAHAHRMIDAANLVDELAPYGIDVPNERTARAILDVPPETRLATILLAHRVSKGSIDSGWVNDANEVVGEIARTGGYVDGGDGNMLAMDAAVIEKRQERMERQRQHIIERTGMKLIRVAKIDTTWEDIGEDILEETDDLYREAKKLRVERTLKVRVYVYIINENPNGRQE